MHLHFSKNFKPLFFFAALLFSSLVCIGQRNGYEITIAYKQPSAENIYLSYYNGTYSKDYVEDSAKLIDPSKPIIFKSKSKINGSIYQLRIGNSKNKIDIAVENGDSLSFELAATDVFTLSSKNSKVNTLFLEYQKSNTSLQRKEEIHAITFSKYPASVAALFYKIEFKKNILKTTKETSKEKIHSEFLTGLYMADTRLPFLPNYYSLLYQYTQILPLTPKNYKLSVANIMKGVPLKIANYPLNLKWVFSNLAFNKTNYLDSLYSFFYEEYIKGKQIKHLSDADKKLFEKKYFLEKQLPNGSKIPEFILRTEADSLLTLASLYEKHALTYMVFFDPECSHCKELMPKLNKLIINLKSQKLDIESVAVLNYDDLLAWKIFIKENKLQNWKNVRADEASKNYKDVFQCYTNPMGFLINQKGQIEDKTTDLKRLEMLIKEMADPKPEKSKK